jgi:glucosamine--fructose-6-phosphate aminotransferase (isomerizing)
MCGIFGYTGSRQAAPLLIDGLKTLEYRGYDSAGMFLSSGERIRAVGKVANLVALASATQPSTAGIAHTRWATHGVPSEENAHPHCDCGERIYLVHNGIIENHAELRTELSRRGHTFHSQTDSEVLAHCIEEELKTNDLETSVRTALGRVRGTYGVAIMDAQSPKTIIVARMGSPIVLGIGDKEYLVASDPSALLRHTKDVIYLDDGEMATLAPDGYRVYRLDSTPLEKTPDHIEWDIEQVQKGGYAHFMLKEIMEIPDVLTNSARGRMMVNEGMVKLGGLETVADRLRTIERLIIVGCGSAYYAGLVGEYMIEEHVGIPVSVELGSEFRYRSPVFEDNTALLVISQSGETADTLASLREAKRRGILTLGIVNTVGSTIARETDAGIYNHAGPEIGVASTKAFVSQLEVLALLTVFLGRQRRMSESEGRTIIESIAALPEMVSRILADTKQIEKIAEKYKSSRDFLYIGRKYLSPIAFEGALKLKEVSYIHAEGYAAGEMKHGPLAMIDPAFPTLALALDDSMKEKLASNIQEIRARSGPVVAVVTEGDLSAGEMADDTIAIPATIEMLAPILAVIPLQLLSYFTGVAKGYDVDKPRNLAKAVTVE